MQLRVAMIIIGMLTTVGLGMWYTVDLADKVERHNMFLRSLTCNDDYLTLQAQALIKASKDVAKYNIKITEVSGFRSNPNFGKAIDPSELFTVNRRLQQCVADVKTDNDHEIIEYGWGTQKLIPDLEAIFLNWQWIYDRQKDLYIYARLNSR